MDLAQVLSGLRPRLTLGRGSCTRGPRDSENTDPTKVCFRMFFLLFIYPSHSLFGVPCWAGLFFLSAVKHINDFST